MKEKKDINKKIYFKHQTETPVFIGRERTAERFLITSLSGFFPVIAQDSDGTLALIVRAGDCHHGQRGYLGLVTSIDGGMGWSRERPVADEGMDIRNPAFGITSRGIWILGYIEFNRYENGIILPWSPECPLYKRHMYIRVRRSTDGGQNWSKPIEIDNLTPNSDSTPGESVFIGRSVFGKIIEMPNNTLLMSLHEDKMVNGKIEKGRSYLIRSTDDGKTWEDPSLIAENYNETSLLSLPSGKLLAMMRHDDPEPNLWQSESMDGGYTWSEPVIVTTDARQHPGDLILLKSGNILLTFGHRIPPYGVRAMISLDEGKTWCHDSTLILSADSSTGDCGYPSSVQLPDGRIYTAYYAADSQGMNQARHFRASYHTAGIRYSEELLLNL